MPNLEEVLHKISGDHITPKADVTKAHTIIIQRLYNNAIRIMREKDELFRHIFSEILYGGSYYDGVKIYKPDEFDLDIRLDPTRLDKRYFLSVTECDSAAYIKIWGDFDKIPSHLGYLSIFGNWFDSDQYLLNENVRNWMDGVVSKSFKELSLAMKPEYELRRSESGPAVTLILLDAVFRDKIMSVDFVPSFEFKIEKLSENFNPLLFEQRITTFLVVPKKPKRNLDQFQDNVERYWRLSFQKQEQAMIHGKQYLKPSLKLLKSLRNHLQAEHIIASYFIKTVFLHMITKYTEDFWSKSLTTVFMTALQEFLDHLQERTIPYFWNSDYNLIEDACDNTLFNWCNRISKIIREINKNPENAYKYLTPLSQSNSESASDTSDEDNSASNCVIT